MAESEPLTDEEISVWVENVRADWQANGPGADRVPPTEVLTVVDALRERVGELEREKKHAREHCHELHDLKVALEKARKERDAARAEVERLRGAVMPIVHTLETLHAAWSDMDSGVCAKKLRAALATPDAEPAPPPLSLPQDEMPAPTLADAWDEGAQWAIESDGDIWDVERKAAPNPYRAEPAPAPLCGAESVSGLRCDRQPHSTGPHRSLTAGARYVAWEAGGPVRVFDDTAKPAPGGDDGK